MRIGVKALPALNVDNVDNYIQLILRIKICIYRVAIVATKNDLSILPILSTFAHALLLPAFSLSLLWIMWTIVFYLSTMPTITAQRIN